MNWITVLEFVSCLVVSCFVLGEAILCVRCNSDKDNAKRSCEFDPPPAQRCHGSSSSRQYCITIRELDKKGALIRFVRDCTDTHLTNSSHEHCEPSKSRGLPGAPDSICYTVCETSHCNAAAPPPSTSLLLLLPPLLALLLHS